MQKVEQCSEFKRWLEKQVAKFKTGKGSHLHVELNGNYSVFPFHGAKEARWSVGTIHSAGNARFRCRSNRLIPDYKDAPNPPLKSLAAVAGKPDR